MAYYSRTVPTLYDSCSTTDGMHYFMVSAHTSAAGVFYDSEIDSGYSVDNLAPAPAQKPAARYAAGKVTLQWRPNGEADFRRYAVYRNTVPTFDEVLAPMLTTTDTLFVDEDLPPSGPVYYVVRAEDTHENLSPLDDGAVLRPITFGDVSGDESISAYDASLLLRYSVHLLSAVDVRLADVTGDGRASAYDAALVLMKVVSPSFQFPVEGGAPPKISSGVPQLAWSQDGSAWTLKSDRPSDIVAGELTVTLPTDEDVVVTSPNLVEYRQDGRVLTLALARTPGHEQTLFRIEPAAAWASPPEIEDVTLNDGQTSVAKPVRLSLDQNVPNPFNPSTTIRFTLPDAGIATVAVYDVTGRSVRVLHDSHMSFGVHHVVWDGRDDVGNEVSSGVYLYRLTTDYGTMVRRMVLVR